MIVHLALDGVAEGPLGLGLDVIDTAVRLGRAGGARATRRAASLAQRVVSLDGRAVRAGNGRRVAVDRALRVRELRTGDVLVLPGLSATTEDAVARLLARGDVLRLLPILRAAHAKGVVIAASCSATFVLAAAGLLDGHDATTTWWLAAAFARRFPAVRLRGDRMLVQTGQVMTAGAAFAHADLMLAVLAQVASPSLARVAARYLLLDARPSQARYMLREHLRADDPAIRAVEAFVGANLERALPLAALARAAGTSPRTLARRFHAALGVTPLAFVQRLRVAQAAHLLDTTRDSVEAVAAQVGYGDPSAFRRVFRRHTGESPRGRR